jgi:hypothetical protein
MRREAFLDFLVTHYRGRHTGRTLMDDSARSYCANLARAEGALRINFDNADLSAVGFDSVSRQLRVTARAAGLSDAKVSDCLSAIQAYAQFVGMGGFDARARPSLTKPPISPKVYQSSPVAPLKQPDPLITHMSVKGLLAMHGAITDELRARKVVRTSNAPGGDYAETLFARAFGWTLENSSALGFDAVDSEGVRYQIKSRRLTGRIGERQLSALRRVPDKTFDYLAAVLFDATYGVSRAIILPHAVIEAGARFRSHTNSWLFMLDDKVWELPDAQDVTATLAGAAEGL